MFKQTKMQTQVSSEFMAWDRNGGQAPLQSSPQFALGITLTSTPQSFKVTGGCLREPEHTISTYHVLQKRPIGVIAYGKTCLGVWPSAGTGVGLSCALFAKLAPARHVSDDEAWCWAHWDTRLCKVLTFCWEARGGREQWERTQRKT